MRKVSRVWLRRVSDRADRILADALILCSDVDQLLATAKDKKKRRRKGR